MKFLSVVTPPPDIYQKLIFWEDKWVVLGLTPPIPPLEAIY